MTAIRDLLLVIEILVCLALIGVILLQRSEGGALGMGGSASSFMTARGAGNLLTRTTAILAALFFILSISLTILGNIQRGASIANKVGSINLNSPAAASAPALPSAPAKSAPSLSDLGQPVLTPNAAPAAAAKKAPSGGSVYLPPLPPGPGQASSSPLTAAPSAPSSPASGPASQ